MNVFELFAKLGLDTSEYEKELEGAETKGAKFGAGLKTAAGVTATGIATVTAATVAGAKAFVEGAADVASFGDRIDKMSQKMNMSAEAFQEWDFVMQHAGTSIDSMQASIKTLSNAAESNSDAFERLGITEEQIASMSGEELFASTITALQGVTDETERTYLAGQLLGRGATELGPLLNMSSEELEEMKQQAHELGGVMSDDAVKAAAGFQDSLQNVQTSISGLKNNMLADFLPAFSTTMDGLANIFSGTDVEGGLTQIEEGIKGIADNIVAKAPEIFAIGGSILEALVGSITSNLPTLLGAAVPVMAQLITTILDYTPSIIDAAFTLINSVVDWLVNQDGLNTIINGIVTLITSLATSLSSNIGTLIPTIVQGILTVITTLTSPQVMIPMLQAGLSLLTELVNGILSAIPLIIEQLPVIISNITTVLLEGLPLILEAGIQIFNALVDSIPVIMESLTEVLPTVIELIVNLVIQGLPLLLEGAIQLLMAIIQAIPTIITALVQNIPTIVTTIISTLLNNLPLLIQGAIELLMGIITAIPTIIVELGKQLPEIITAIVNGLTDGIGQIISVGGDLIRGLWQGISDMASWIGEKIKGFGEGIVNGLKDFFGIASPSKLFKNEIGKNLALGVGEGFSSEMDSVSKDMVSSASSLAEDISDAMSVDASVAMDRWTMKPSMKQKDRNGFGDIETLINKKLSNIEISAPIYIGGKKIDQQLVTANARNMFISGGR
jgi:phage-related protein